MNRAMIYSCIRKKPFSVLMIIAFVMMSFSNASRSGMDGEKDRIGNISLHSSAQNNWGSWKSDSCFTQIKYRVKKGSYPAKWDIEFKNNYHKSTSMSVSIENGYGGERYHIGPGETKSTYFWTESEAAIRIDFTIDKVKFDDTSQGGPYANCD